VAAAVSVLGRKIPVLRVRAADILLPLDFDQAERSQVLAGGNERLGRLVYCEAVAQQTSAIVEAIA
jgi:hypothetical protein